MRRILKRNEILQSSKNLIYLTLHIYYKSLPLSALYRLQDYKENHAIPQLLRPAIRDCIRGVCHGYCSQEHGLQVHGVTTAVSSVTPYGVATPHITADTELRPFYGVIRVGLRLLNEVVCSSSCFTGIAPVY